MISPAPDITDAYVSHAEAAATQAGETRHHIRLRIGPVERHAVWLRPGRRTVEYLTYRSDRVWEVHYRGDGPLRFAWSAWDVVR